jgi:hypothetical protein
MKEDGNDRGQPRERWQHFGEIIRPDLLWRWTIERNPTLQHFELVLRDWGKRRANPNRRPLCLTCNHGFRPEESIPLAWLFVRMMVNNVGVPRQMILVGVCEGCAVKDDATLLREGVADLRRAFPDMPEFKVQVVQETSAAVN